MRRERPAARRDGSPRTLAAAGRRVATKGALPGRANSFPSTRLKRRAAIPSPDSPHDKGRSRRQPARARQVSNPLRSNSNRWIAERIRRAIAALESNLMRPVSVREAYPVVLCQLEAAARVRIGHDLSAWHAVGIELVVPRRVERVGPIDPLAVAADLNHLRTACIHLAVRVRCAASNAADVDRARKLRLPRVRDIVLTHLAGSPAGDVEEPVIHGKVNVGHQRRHCAKPLQERWKLFLGRRLGRDRCRLFDVKLAAFAPPGPDRAFEVRCVDYDAKKPVLANRIVRRAHLEGHLVVGAKIDRLDIAPGSKIPEMNSMTVLVREQIFRDDPVLELRRQRPFTCHHVVARQVPPEIIMQVLWSAIDLPAAEDIERLAVHDEHARWPIGAILAAAAERADVYAFRTAMNRVGPRITGLLEDLLWLDDLVNFCLGGIGLRVNDINARGADPGDDQVTALYERVAGERRQRRRAGVPTEMVEFVALVGHRYRVDDLAICARAGLHVDHRKRVGLREVRAE